MAAGRSRLFGKIGGADTDAIRAAESEQSLRVKNLLAGASGPLGNPFIQKLGTTLLGQLNQPLSEFEPMLRGDEEEYSNYGEGWRGEVGERHSTAITGDFEQRSVEINDRAKQNVSSEITAFNLPESFTKSGGMKGLLPDVHRLVERSYQEGDAEFGREDSRVITPYYSEEVKEDYNPEWRVDRYSGKNTPVRNFATGGEAGGDYDRSYFKGKENVAEKLHRVFGGSRLDDALTKMETRLMEQEKYDSPLAKMLNMKIGSEVNRITNY
jgi:hypothetical protein